MVELYHQILSQLWTFVQSLAPERLTNMHDIIVSSLISTERERLQVGETRLEELQPFLRGPRALFNSFNIGGKNGGAKSTEREARPTDCVSAHCSCKPAH